MKKNSPFSLPALIFITFALAAISTGIVLASGSHPAGQNNSPVQAASLNNVSGKIVEAQSTPEPTLAPTQEPTLETAPGDNSLEAAQAPEAESTEVENADDSSSGNSFSEDSPAERLSESGSTSPATSIANPFSSGTSEGHRFLQGVSPRPATKIANPFSSEAGHR